MKSGVRALDDFPCVRIPANARDSQYQVLGWQQVAAKIGMQRCAASSQWLNDRISLSRYAHVPLGNFEVDSLMHTADIFFSRALRDNQQVHQPFIITKPGAYRKVTVELKIHHLAVDALLKSNQVNEMEGGALLGFEPDMNSGSHTFNVQAAFDEATSSAPVFCVLKQLIHRCLADAHTSGNVYADALLQHLYRWLCSNHMSMPDEVNQVVRHDLIHAFDDCRAGNMGWANCAHHSCIKIRVGHLSGDCHYKREFLRFLCSLLTELLEIQ